MTFFEFCEKYNLELISKGEDREIEGGFSATCTAGQWQMPTKTLPGSLLWAT